MKNVPFLLILSVAAAAAGCLGFEHKSSVTRPSATGISALLGNWSSSSLIPSPNACTDFKWNVTEQTATTAKGSFSATCTGDLKLSGTAQGTLSGGGISWTAQGLATAPGLPSCSISLTGTAELGLDSIRVPYTGDTCLGKVSGTEILRRN
ncbi:MAG: hypothetical protein LC753_07070 [Acidobacteria bacterium]|nr:hypothetical protein [Acidobacteriota bacterium]MCA1650045.1 hypothetical protein [Acidobacteriota bacterium]